MIEFVRNEPEEIFREMVADFEATAGETLRPGDEHYQFLRQLTMAIVALRASINDTGNQNLLPGARGDVLDAYGEDYDVPRLPATKAATMLRFALQATLDYAMAIPAGTRVTPDGVMMFATTEAATIHVGETAAEVDAQAMQEGEAYNGFVPGQIASMVDVIPNVDSVKNVTASAGGADRESDADYVERIRLSWESHSTAGCEEGYRFWAMSASGGVASVGVTNPSDGVVRLHVLGKGGEADEALLEAVRQAVSAQKRRPLTDKVEVVAAQRHEFAINAKYYVSRHDATREAAIKAAVPEAVATYLEGCSAALGGYINPDDLREALRAAGVYHVEIASPELTELQPFEYGACTVPVLEYGGLL